MKKQSDQVKEFREAFNLPINVGIENISIDNTELHIKLINEEVDELINALYDADIIEVADAITDIRYLLCGLELELGIQDKAEEIFDEVHYSNMSKLENDKPIYREDGKVLKGKDYFKPNIENILNK